MHVLYDCRDWHVVRVEIENDVDHFEKIARDDGTKNWSWEGTSCCFLPRSLKDDQNRFRQARTDILEVQRLPRKG